METVKDQFDKFTRRAGLGAREDIENYPNAPTSPQFEETRRVAQSLIASARRQFPEMPEIYFDFVRNPSVNAWAFRLEKGYGIGITSGAVILVGMLFHYMLATRSLFREIGIPDEEAESLPSIPWTHLNAKTLYESGHLPVSPIGKERALYAWHLTQEGINFLVGHEIAHITRGHVDFWQSEFGTGMIPEIGWTGTSNTELVRQAMELDADARSMYSRIATAHDNFHALSGTQPPWTNKQVSVLDFHFDWLFAVNGVFRLFGDKRFAEQDLTASYPPLPVRRLHAIASCRPLLAAPTESAQTMIWRFLLHAAGALENAFITIQGEPSDGGLAQASEDATQEHFKRIRSVWQEVKSKMQNYSFEKL